MAHLQVTQRCNLRCPFCGQWGDKGFAKDRPQGEELSPEEWIGIVEQIEDFEKDSPTPPAFTVWGGEPLLYKGLDRVMEKAASYGSKSSIVSNGLLLAGNAEMVGRLFKTLFISLDGPGLEHDKVRRHEGLHAAIEKGMEAMRPFQTEKVCLSTITDLNWSKMAETSLDAQSLGFDKIIFQNLIFMLPHEQRLYDRWLRDAFALVETKSSSWTYGSVPEFSRNLPKAMAEMEDRIAKGDFKIKVEFHPHGIGSRNIDARMRGDPDFIKEGPKHCLGPFRHINVSPEGEVRFCVDYSDVSLGSLKKASLKEILSSQAAESFREGVVAARNPACPRCPWRRVEYQ